MRICIDNTNRTKQQEAESLYIEINLQFFAGGDDKTEPATPKKLEDARKEGQVSKSREVGMGLSLLGLFVALKFYIGTLGERFVGTFQSIYTRIPEFVGTEGTHDSGAFLMLLKDCIVDMLIMMAPFLLVGVVIAFVAFSFIAPLSTFCGTAAAIFFAFAISFLSVVSSSSISLLRSFVDSATIRTPDFHVQLPHGRIREVVRREQPFAGAFVALAERAVLQF